MGAAARRPPLRREGDELIVELAERIDAKADHADEKIAIPDFEPSRTVHINEISHGAGPVVVDRQH